jgi:DNA-binding winged helix-turn-helix (wHTH) protein/tetratricopeptide (TPR) repeat protein
LPDKDIEHPTVELYRFGPFVLDPAQRRLSKDGTPVPLTVKSFDLLVLLVANHGKLLTKDEILGCVWDGADTYESSLTSHVSMVRGALGETKNCPYIETVPKKGYRFIGHVELTSGTSQPVAISTTPVRGSVRGPWHHHFTGLVTVAIVTATAIALWHRRPPTTPGEVRLYRQAIDLERQGNDSLALQKLNEALRVRPQFDEANLRAAWICYEDDDDDSALNYVNAVLSRKGQGPNSVRLQAEALRILLQGGREEAFNKLQLVTEADPARTDALYALSEIAIDLGLFDQADAALQRCKAADSRNPFCTFETVSLRVYQNRFAEAVSEYHRARTNSAFYPWLDEPAGFAKLGQGDLDGALEHFRALEEAGRRFASNVHFRASQEGIAAVALYQGRLQDAHRQILDALETSNSGYDKASYNLSLAHMDALHNRTAEAMREANAAAQESEAPDVAVSAARALAMAGEFDSASALLAKHSGASATLGKQYPAAEQFLAGIRAISRRKHDDAIAALKDSYKLEPDPETAYYLAQAQISESQWTEAAATLNDLLRSKGTILMDGVVSLIPLAEYTLATCYQHLGNHSEAASLSEGVRTLWQHADPELHNALR